MQGVSTTGFVRTLTTLSFAALMAAGLAAPANAQSVTDLAKLSGPDRMQRLIEGAKKEGTLTLYTSQTPDDVAVIISTFEKKYGIKVRLWRGSSEDILQRSVVENRAKRYEADVYETNGPEMEALSRENLLQPIESPVFADLIPEAVAPKSWIGTRLNIITGAINTNQVKKADAPKSYEDLKDPKWKGKLGIEAGDADWFATVVTAMGEEKGLKLFKDIVATNGVSVRKGHTLLANLVSSGEIPVSLTVYLYKANQFKTKGAPIDSFILPPAVGRVNGVGVAAQSPHPHAAILFFDFLLTDSQQILAEREFFPTNKKYLQLPEGLDLKLVDSGLMLDQGKKWDKLFQEIVLRQSR